ncbi:hypothetical protein RJ639_025414 [Escallonia herrerae]|uniref:Uncharacterized protein n=1 Tax=Escallonia herrerae TaxID=1293975 RepID=A0AA88UXZ0_9ASTE|nr:hypothetical protein RJ639_025414 [Escallonia herrerae]
MSTEKEEVLHIVMFPWLAMGHLIPFLHLSKCLAQKGHKISFISTPRNLQRLPKVPTNLSPLITLTPLSFPQNENLPHQAESSMDIPFQKSQFLKIAFDSLESPLTQFLQTADPKPDWIIFDYASHWLPPLADKLGISRAFFSLFNAATMAFIGPAEVLLTGEDNRKTADDFTVVPEWVPFESNVAFRVHEVVKFVEGSNESGTSDMVRFGAAINGSDLILMRTCVEFEPEWFELLRELYRKPVVSVGVLPPDLEGSELENGEKWVCVREWLDKQGVSSVVFVALGTEATLTQTELRKKVGVEIPRDNRDGSFTSDSVVDTVRFAMVGEEGESIRANAREMRRLFGDKNSNDHYVDSSVHCLLERKTSN